MPCAWFDIIPTDSFGATCLSTTPIWFLCKNLLDLKDLVHAALCYIDSRASNMLGRLTLEIPHNDLGQKHFGSQSPVFFLNRTWYIDHPQQKRNHKYQDFPTQRNIGRLDVLFGHMGFVSKRHRKIHLPSRSRAPNWSCWVVSNGLRGRIASWGVEHPINPMINMENTRFFLLTF